ncbi:MAG: polysaccharide pyruvyl transferase family protein [Proteobacteria bacterium]|nr:polysaccharide pyruvyl transferase family protein [Pseudomonadota bacterium]
MLLRVLLEIRIQIRTFRNLGGITDLIVSGGGQLDDYWGGAFAHPYTLLKWALLARLRGARVSVVSVGAGPIDSSLSALFIKRTLSLAWYRSYRDDRSAKLVASLGFDRGDRVYPDLAHSLKITVNGRRPKPDGPQLTIGVGPMAYFEYSWPERDAGVYRDYLGKLSAFVVWALRQGHSIRLFPGEAGADKDVISDLKAMVQERMGPIEETRLISPRIETVDELLRELKHADVVVASRFHGVLLAHLMGVPVVALSYHQKIDVLMRDMGHAHYCLNIRTFTESELLGRFAKMTSVLPEERDRVVATEHQYRARLDEQYDHLFSTLQS